MELQRFAREDRYRLQDMAREGSLLLTVDVDEAAATGPWEELFLTTPRRADVQRLRVQMLQAQLPWRVTRPLLSEESSEARGQRREKGQVESRPAGTLDECAAAVTAAAGSGRIGEMIHLTAPLAEDVQLLLRALGDRGWAAVARSEFEPLLMPGMLEWLAALADAHRRRHGHWPGAAGRTLAPDCPWLLASLLPAAEAADWGTWLRSLPEAVLDDVTVFTERLRRTPWSPLARIRAQARERVTAFLTAAAGAPGDVISVDLWQVWRRQLAMLLDREDLAVGPAAACLASATQPQGLLAESSVYVCFGPEPPAVHRAVLARATDRLLVLYQEHSPLPGERENEAGP
jgi:hypothetical protein